MWNTTVIYSLFPNTILMLQGDHVELSRVFPCEGRVDRAVMELSLYIPRAPVTQDERTHWDKNMQLVLDIVTGEDFPAGRSIQLGADLGRADPHGVRPQRARHDPLSSANASRARPPGSGGDAASRRIAPGRAQRSASASLAPSATNAAAKVRRIQVNTRGREMTWVRIDAAQSP